MSHRSFFQRMSAFVLFGAVVCAGGCGGGSSAGGSPSVGSAVLTVKWPSRSRLVPVSSNSIVVTLSFGTQQVATQLVPRPTGDTPTSTVTFTDLPFEQLSVSATAYPNADGSGNAQASGSGLLTETVGQVGAVTVSMASTVTALSIQPSPIVCNKGLTTTLTASATDANGNIVLLQVGSAQESLTWSTGDSTIATVSGTGPTAALLGVDGGSTTVSVSMQVDDQGDLVSTQASAPVTSGTGVVTVE